MKVSSTITNRRNIARELPAQQLTFRRYFLSCESIFEEGSTSRCASEKASHSRFPGSFALHGAPSLRKKRGCRDRSRLYSRHVEDASEAILWTRHPSIFIFRVWHSGKTVSLVARVINHGWARRLHVLARASSTEESLRFLVAPVTMHLDLLSTWRW